MNDHEFWRGEVSGRLDAFDDRQERQGEMLEKVDDKLNDLASDVAALKVTAGFFGTVSGFAGALLMRFFGDQ